MMPDRTAGILNWDEAVATELTLRRQLATVTAERDQARAGRHLVLRIGEEFAAERDQARAWAKAWKRAAKRGWPHWRLTRLLNRDGCANIKPMTLEKAELAAAAPELLEVLREVRGILFDEAVFEPSSGLRDYCLEVLDTAITKIEEGE
jgi:hypothetical protein